MNSTNQPSVPSIHHPLNIVVKDAEEARLRAELVIPLANGLAEAGAVFRHVRLGRPYRRGVRYEFVLDGGECALRLESYGRLRWVWRMTVSSPWQYHSVLCHHELTFDIEEMDAKMGRDLAVMLRALAAGEKPVWPLFDHDQSFPRYAWTKLCESRYEDWRKWRESMHEAASWKPIKMQAFV
jgi:hypothetical protein